MYQIIILIIKLNEYKKTYDIYYLLLKHVKIIDLYIFSYF